MDGLGTGGVILPFCDREETGIGNGSSWQNGERVVHQEKKMIKDRNRLHWRT